jgi:hypothetical protein
MVDIDQGIVKFHSLFLALIEIQFELVWINISYCIFQ